MHPDNGNFAETASVETLLRELEALKNDKNELEEKRYIDARMAAFVETLRWRLDDTLNQWADRVLTEMIQGVDGLQGAFYVASEDSSALKLAASYAAPPETPQTVEPGVGVSGQAVKTRQPRYFENQDTFYSFNYSSLSRIQAQSLSITPLIYNEQVEGLLELSAARPFERRALDLIKSLSDSVAANLSTIRNQEKIQRLYREAQEKSNALSTQEEELRQNLEELQATQEQMRLARLEIERSTHFIEATLNSTNLMFIATDEVGIVRFWNEAAVQQLGYTVEEMVGVLTPGAFHDGDEVVQEAARLSEVYQIDVEPGFDVFKVAPYRGDRYEREWTYIRKNGERFPVNLNITAWRAGDGATGLIGVAQDITDKKIVQEELDRQSEELKKNYEALSAAQAGLLGAQEEARNQRDAIKSIIDAIKDSIVAVDTDYNIIHFNETNRALLAANGVEQKIGAPYQSVVSPSEWEKLKVLWDKAFTGEAFTEEITYFFENTGQTFYYELNYNPLRRPDGSVYGAVLYASDVTLVRTAQNAIDAQRQRLLTIANSIQGNIALFSADMRLLFFNEGYGAAFAANGITLKENMAFSDFVNPAEINWVIDNFTRAFNGESFNIEITYKFSDAPDAPTYYYLSSWSPYRTPDGETIGVVLFTRDITDRKLLELAIQQSNEELEAQSEELRQNLEELAATQEQMRDTQRAIQYQSEQLLGVINNINGIIYLIGPDFTLQLYNEAFRQLLADNGITVYNGMPVREFVAPAEYDKLSSLIQRAFTGENVFEEISYQFEGLDHPKYFDVSYTPYKNALGEILGVVLFTREVTERKLLELTVQQKNEELESQSEKLTQNLEELAAVQRAVEIERARLLSIANNLDGNVALFDPEYRLTFYNKGWEKTFAAQGVSLQTGLSIYEFVTPDTLNWFKESIDRALNGESFAVEVPYKFTPDATETFYYLSSWTPEKDAAGNISGALILGRDVTVRVRQEQEIARSRDNVQAIINNIDGQIMCVDTDYNILYFNHAATYSMPGIAIGAAMEPLIDATEWAKHADSRARAVNGESFSDEFRYEIPGARALYYRVNYIPMKDENGGVNQILIHTYDITERKELELAVQRKNEELEAQSEELRQNLEELAATQEQMQDARSGREQESIRLSGVVNNLKGLVSLYDADKKLVYFNEAFRQTLTQSGMSPHVGMDLAEYVTDAAQYAFIGSMIDRAFSGESVTEQMDFAIQGTDQIVSYELTYSPYKDEAGKIVGVINFSQDITVNRERERKADKVVQQKQAEMAVLSARNQEQASVLQLLEFTFLVAEFDLEGNFIRVNDNYARLLGFSSEELIGQNYSVILPRDYAHTEPYKQFWQNLKAGKTYKGEVLRIRKDGHRVWLQAAYKPIFNAEGAVYKILQMAHDATRNPKP